MFKHYLKTATRSLLTSRFFSLLNVAGLALSMAGCLLIFLWVSDERSFDRFNDKADRIYRLNTGLKFGATSTERAIAPPAAAAAAKKTFPEVEEAVRLLPGTALIRKGSAFISEEHLATVDPTIFKVFSFPLISGNPGTVLTEPGSIVISESIAKKYFGRTGVVGEGLSFMEGNNLYVHRIAGVMKDMPENGHFRYDLLVSMVDNEYSKQPDFAAILPFSTYLLLKPGASAQKLATRLPAFMCANLPFYDDLQTGGDYMRFSLTPLTKIHLESAMMNELGQNGSLEYVKIFSLAGVLILFVACFNFMNLSTAKSAGRTREVGVRKVLGSSRLALIARFLTESMLLTGASLLLAWVFAWALLPAFNRVSGKEMTFGFETIFRLIPVTIALLLLVGLAAGAYAAFFLSGFRPIEVLKGNIALGMKGRGLRDYLVVFQFAISIFLVLCTMVVYRQLHFIHNKNIGFDRNEVLVLKNMNSLTESQAAFLKTSIGKLSGVADLAMSSFLPSGRRRWSNFIAASDSNAVQNEFWPVDDRYIPCLGIKMATGRNFSREFPSDSNAVIINEAAVRALGFKSDNVIGKPLYYQHDKIFHIIGVTKDFNFNSLKEAVSPAVLIQLNDWATKTEGDGADNLLIRLRSNQASPILSAIADRWKSLGSAQPLAYSFLDADFESLYKGEERMASIFIQFTILGLVIACLGLFGLAAFAAEQRGREIAVRKVLGASVISILMLMSKNFIRLIIISMLIGIPLAWIAIGRWLKDFAYRADVPIWLPIIASGITFVIAIFTITAQSLRAATKNPARILQAE